MHASDTCSPLHLHGRTDEGTSSLLSLSRPRSRRLDTRHRASSLRAAFARIVLSRADEVWQGPRAVQAPGWEEEYINYRALKNILRKLEEEGASKDEVDGEFFAELEDELEKVSTVAASAAWVRCQFDRRDGRTPVCR